MVGLEYMTKLEYRVYRLIKDECTSSFLFEEMKKHGIGNPEILRLTNYEIARMLRTTTTSIENVFMHFYSRGWFHILRQNKKLQQRILIRHIRVNESTREVLFL